MLLSANDCNILVFKTGILSGFIWLTQKFKILDYPVDIYLFKVSNGNTGTICENCLKLKVKTPDRRQRRCSWSKVSYKDL